MRRAAVLSAAAAVLTLATTAGTATAARPPSCKSGTTLARSASVRVFRLANNPNAYVCLSGRTATRLPHDTGPTYRPGPYSTAGDFVAYPAARATGDGQPPIGEIAVFDVRHRKQTTLQNAYKHGEQGSYVDSIVVTATGRVAWIGCLNTCTVQSATGNHTRTLDSAHGVAKHSLRRRGDRVMWRRAGSLRNAVL